MRARMVSLGLALLIMVAAFAAMGINGFNYALDFTGGTVAELRFQKPVSAEVVRQRLQAGGFESPVVQTFGAGNEIVVRLKPRGGNRAASSGQAIATAAQA